jgi:hypothetical protein
MSIIMSGRFVGRLQVVTTKKLPISLGKQSRPTTLARDSHGPSAQPCMSSANKKYRVSNDWYDCHVVFVTRQQIVVDVSNRSGKRLRNSFQ